MRVIEYEEVCINVDDSGGYAAEVDLVEGPVEAEPGVHVYACTRGRKTSSTRSAIVPSSMVP